MKQITNILIILTLLVMTACTSQGSTSFSLPEDYRSWKRPIKRVLDNPVPGHGASYRIIYANGKTFEGKKIDGLFTVPDGAILIKENYVSRKDIKKGKYFDLTIMVKNSKAPDAVAGWLYYVKEQDKPVVSVKGRKCVGCHEAANEPHPYFKKNPRGEFRDFLFIPL